MKIIVDASVALSWYLNEEAPLANSAMRQLIAGRLGAIVPHIWLLEVINGLLISERRRRISPDQADLAITAAHKVVVETKPMPAVGAIIEAARQHRLTAYDATYLVLAQRMNLPLATLDRQLADAAASAGVALFAPSAS